MTLRARYPARLSRIVRASSARWKVLTQNAATPHRETRHIDAGATDSDSDAMGSSQYVVDLINPINPRRKALRTLFRYSFYDDATVLFGIDDVGDWAFNPFARQRMFVLAFAVAKLFVLTQPLPGTLKHNLSVNRVIDFLAMLYLTARPLRTAVHDARCG